MKKILLLLDALPTNPSPTGGVNFRNLVQEHMPDTTKLEITALNRLTYVLDGDDSRIYDAKQGFDVSDFDAVVFRLVGQRRDEAVAVAAYCRKKNIPYIDKYIPLVGSKLGSAFVRWEHNLPTPKTIHGPVETMVNELKTVGLPAVLKATNGKKGRDNYLINSADELRHYVTAPEAPQFILQNFVRNDGDYRFLVMNDSVRLVIRRRASGNSHLNNTSQGGSAELVPVDSFPEEVIQLARDAAALDELQVSGVDLIQDLDTGEYSILEVNRAPQITTGGFTENKIAEYAKALQELVEGGEKS